MQLDGGRTFAAGLAARLRSTLERVSLRCAVALYSLHSEWHSLLYGARRAVHRSSSSTYIGKRVGTSEAPIFGIQWLWSRLQQVSYVSAHGEHGQRELPPATEQHLCEVCVLFERAHSLEPAHIHSTALACCAQCTSCEAIVCARSVSVDSAAMKTIGVISMAAFLALGMFLET